MNFTNSITITLNKEIKNTRELILYLENTIQREESRKKAGKSYLYNIDALRSVKKTYEHNYNNLLDAKYSFLEMHIAEDIENERGLIE